MAGYGYPNQVPAAPTCDARQKLDLRRRPADNPGGTRGRRNDHNIICALFGVRGRVAAARTNYPRCEVVRYPARRSRRCSRDGARDIVPPRQRPQTGEGMRPRLPMECTRKNRLHWTAIARQETRVLRRRLLPTS